ncbi:MAG: ABC transporter substrate-binding protein [Bacteroidota bacterium]
MKYVTIGGVPEHFNLPWHLLIEELNSGNASARLDWQDFPGGTGEMCAALRSESIEMAVLLTEGIIKDIDAGNRSEIVEVYISSPLIWGVHVAAGSKFNTLDDLKGAKAAISRVGSGSDLMTKVLADTGGWSKENIPVEIVGGLDGGRKALADGTADYFMWEKYMTKPYVDNGEFRRIGECPTPWPAFVIAVGRRFMSENADLVHSIIELIREKATWVKESPEAIQVFADNYGLRPTDIADWRLQTLWMQDSWTPELEADIRSKMKKFGII